MLTVDPTGAAGADGAPPITLVGIGSRGDIEPLVALGLALRRAGHGVRLAAPGTFRGLAMLWSMPFVDLGLDVRTVLEGEVGRRYIAAGSNPVAVLAAWRALVSEVATPLISSIVRALAGAEVVVSGLTTLPICLAVGAPHAFLFEPFPFQPTGARPSVLTPPSLLRSLPGGVGRTYNLLTHRIVEELCWLPLARIVNDALSAAGARQLRGNPLRSPEWVNTPVLGAYSPHVVPPAPDRHRRHHTTGWWLLPPHPSWEPRPELERFLGAGPPPVYVGMGSMIGRDTEGLARIVVTGLREAGVRGVVATGWGGMRDLASAEDVYVLDEAPHAWLFPQVAAVVHHGGSGTTGAGLAAGRPTLVCPYLTDQFFWGDRVATLGAGPAPIPRKRLTPDALGRALRSMTGSDGYAARAGELGALLRREDGPSEAVETLRRCIGSTG